MQYHYKMYVTTTMVSKSFFCATLRHTKGNFCPKLIKNPYINGEVRKPTNN